MLKTLMTGVLLVATTALPLSAQQGPGCGRYDNCPPRGGGRGGSYSRICTNSPNGRLNIRTGPGTNYRRLGQVPNGAQVPIWGSARGRDGQSYRWQNISYNGVQGWVRSDYVCD